MHANTILTPIDLQLTYSGSSKYLIHVGEIRSFQNINTLTFRL